MHYIKKVQEFLLKQVIQNKQNNIGKQKFYACDEVFFSLGNLDASRLDSIISGQYMLHEYIYYVVKSNFTYFCINLCTKFL